MKKVILALLVCASFGADAAPAPICSKTFDNEQLSTLRFVYREGAYRGYGWTLAAMAWQETSAGKYRINWNDPSFGVLQINIKTAVKRYGKESHGDQMGLALRLTRDDEFSVMAASDELDFWAGVHKDNWAKMVASYNGGYNYSKAQPQKYLSKIREKIKFLKTNKCLSYE